jgi:PHD/YefM family antitoxin component YafN of YafNO toxin-antitoxin module
MTVIVPITEMRDTSKMFEMSENQPVFITKNGYGARVLINLEHYNKVKDILFDLELERRYQVSESDNKNIDAKEFIQRLMDE